MPGLNASQHLQSLGWAGPGHPLNPNAYKQKGSRGLAYDPTAAASSNTTSSSSSNSSSYFAAGGNGLIRPLLVSKKSGNLGLGRRTHEPQKGNEWWLKGFEAALAGTGNTSAAGSKSGSGASTPATGRADGELQRSVNVQTGRFGGLYGFFVRGETVGGTIGGEDLGGLGEGRGEGGGRGVKTRKRKSEVLDNETDGSGDSDGVSVAKKNKKRKKGEEVHSGNANGSAVDAHAHFSQIATFMSVRDQSSAVKKRSAVERAERKKLRESEQFRVAGQWLGMGLKDGRNGHGNGDGPIQGSVDADADEDEVRDGAVKEPARQGASDGKSKKRRTKRLVTDGDGVQREETREERRARRGARRERKERKKQATTDRPRGIVAVLGAGASTPGTTTSAGTSSEEGEDEEAAKRRRKEERRERRRRKERGVENGSG